jgi:hypothetical protein
MLLLSEWHYFEMCMYFDWTFLFSDLIVMRPKSKRMFQMNAKHQKLKNAAFWDVTPCGSCKNRRFGGM